MSYLPVLAGIAPAGLRRQAATLALARKAQQHDWHILHETTTRAAPPSRLKSRHPYNRTVQEMLGSIPEGLCMAGNKCMAGNLLEAGMGVG